MPNTKAETRREFTRRNDRIEEFVGRIESCGDLATRAVAQELLNAVMELHGEALERIVKTIAQLPEGNKALDALAGDELVSGVLSLHNIHPAASAVRVESAIQTTGLFLRPQGGEDESASIQDGTARGLLHAARSSSVETLKQTVERAIYSVAPEIFSVAAESSPTQAHVAVQTH